MVPGGRSSLPSSAGRASQRQVGRLLGRSVSTICRELARGRMRGDPGSGSCPQAGLRIHDRRRLRCRPRRKLIVARALWRFATLAKMEGNAAAALEGFTQRDLDHMTYRPRKSLGWKTPAQALAEDIAKAATGVAVGTLVNPS